MRSLQFWLNHLHSSKLSHWATMAWWNVQSQHTWAAWIRQVDWKALSARNAAGMGHPQLLWAACARVSMLHAWLEMENWTVLRHGRSSRKKKIDCSTGQLPIKFWKSHSWHDLVTEPHLHDFSRWWWWAGLCKEFTRGRWMSLKVSHRIFKWLRLKKTSKII